MPCPEQIVILEAAIPVLSVALLVALIMLVREIRLSKAAWQARHQRRQALQEALAVLQSAADELLEAEGRSGSGAAEGWGKGDEKEALAV